jgi:hypothetical protein
MAKPPILIRKEGLPMVRIKKIIILFLLFILPCTISFAGNSVSVRVSVTIPALLGITDKAEADDEAETDSDEGPKFYYREYTVIVEEAVRNSEKVLLKTFVVR